MLDQKQREMILRIQRNEITEHVVYKKLAASVKIREQAEILSKISDEELVHYEFFRSLTQERVRCDRFKVPVYVFISKIFGLNFGLRLMERGEDMAQNTYDGLKEISPRIEQIAQEERKHELDLIGLIDEERLRYVSSMVLGLNDALVELTGALAGFTLALQNPRLIGVVGLITGIAGSLSMASSEYLSTKEEETEKNPLKASIYTGCAYVGTVFLLVFPYFFFKNIFFSLGLAVADALIVITIFSFYISVAKGLAFKKRFLEMAGISLGIAAITFFIGFLIRNAFGIEI